MNLTSPFLKGAVDVAALPGESMTSFLKMVSDSTGLFADESPDGWFGLAMSGLAGIATALAVVIVMVYFRSRYRRSRDSVRHGLAAALVLALVAFVASDMRHAALAFLGINPARPAVEFEIRLPTKAVAAAADAQIELHTDRNQTLAQVQNMLTRDEADHIVLRGLAPLAYRTTDRVVVVNLPGQRICEFKLRLAASPSHSEEFGPWHLADRVASLSGGEETRGQQHDAFAIRYRVR